MNWTTIKEGLLWQGEHGFTIVYNRGKYHIVRNVNGVQVEKGYLYSLENAQQYAEELSK